MTASYFAVDAPGTCRQCGEPLGDSPSAVYCGETCQTQWLRTRAEPLPPVEDRAALLHD